jgi:hypothetical protein
LFFSSTSFFFFYYYCNSSSSRKLERTKSGAAARADVDATEENMVM